MNMIPLEKENSVVKQVRDICSAPQPHRGSRKTPRQEQDAEKAYN